MSLEKPEPMTNGKVTYARDGAVALITLTNPPANGYSYEMMRDHPHVRDFQAELAREIEAARPKYVVMVNVMASWQPARLAQPDLYVFEWAERFLREQYKRVGLVEIRWPLEKYGRLCWDAPGAPCRTPAAQGGASPLWLSIHARRPDHS